jgi:hypothetical protein
MKLFELFERIKDPVDIAARAGKMYGKEKDYGYDDSETIPGKYIPLKNFNDEWVREMEYTFYEIYSKFDWEKLSSANKIQLRIKLENEASSTKNVPINKLYATQPFVRIEDVETLKNKIASAKEITVVIFGERMFIRDGHHAVLAARLRGETTVPAQVIDLNFLKEKYL